jgi:hypothetical protein
MIPFSLLALHFVADFLLQSDWMACGLSACTRGRMTNGWVAMAPFYFLMAGTAAGIHYGQS